MTTPELPSVGFYDRLTDAMQAWERRHGRVGQRGNQAQLLARMRERFGDAAPTQAAVSQWFRREVVPGPDAGVMLAFALDVRAEWLSLGLGPMRDEGKSKRDSDPTLPSNMDGLTPRLQSTPLPRDEGAAQVPKRRKRGGA